LICRDLNIFPRIRVPDVAYRDHLVMRDKKFCTFFFLNKSMGVFPLNFALDPSNICFFFLNKETKGAREALNHFFPAYAMALCVWITSAVAAPHPQESPRLHSGHVQAVSLGQGCLGISLSQQGLVFILTGVVVLGETNSKPHQRHSKAGWMSDAVCIGR